MYKKILVPLDGSELAECVLPHAESIAGGCGVETVVFLRVIEPFDGAPMGGDWVGMFSEKDIQRFNLERRAEAEKYLGNLASQAKYGEARAQTEVLLGGATAESIAKYATEAEIDLIIIATHGRSGVSRWVWGSVADRILRSACVPVLMVRAPGCVPGI